MRLTTAATTAVSAVPVEGSRADPRVEAAVSVVPVGGVEGGSKGGGEGGGQARPPQLYPAVAQPALLENTALMRALLQSLRALALSNMLSINVTPDMSKDVSGWLKAVASSNMYSMLVTRDVSKDVSGWLKAVAPENKPCMLVTRDVLKKSSGWLKATA